MIKTAVKTVVQLVAPMGTETVEHLATTTVDATADTWESMMVA